MRSAGKKRWSSSEWGLLPAPAKPRNRLPRSLPLKSLLRPNPSLQLLMQALWLSHLFLRLRLKQLKV
jgi:hypothetical protein